MLRALLLLLFALPAWASPFATADVSDPRATHCDYEDTTTGETARVPVVVDTVRGLAVNGHRVCKFDIAHWLPGSSHAARMRAVVISTGEVSAWTSATLDRPASATVTLALVGNAASPPPDPPPPQPSMPIALVQFKTGVSALATTTAAFDSTPTDGNLIVLAFAADDYNGSPNAGWTQSTGMEQQTFHGGYIWWRIAAGGSNAFQYTIGSASNSAWILAEFSGVDASPYDVSAGTLAASGSTASLTTPTLTPTAGDRVVVAMLGASSSLSSLSGMTVGSWANSFTNIAGVGTNGGGTNDGLGLAYRLVTANGSTSYTTSGTYSIANESRSALSIAFKAAAGGGSSILRQMMAHHGH